MAQTGRVGAEVAAGSTTENTVGPSRRYVFLRRLLRRPQNVFSLLVVFTLVSFALLSPFIAPYDPLEAHFQDRLASPSPRFWLGTDQLGRDILSRIIYGARVSLSAALVPIVGSMFVGVFLGLLAGYVGGIVDTLVMSVMDAILAIPGLILILGITAVLGPSMRNALIAITVTGIPGFCRMVRGQVLSVAQNDYILAAEALGCTRNRILGRHILPNVTGPIVVMAALRVGGAIMAEASLSFLGLGVQPPTPSWGTMVALGNPYLREAPWVSVAPGMAIFLITLAANFLGDGLREAYAPQQRGS